MAVFLVEGLAILIFIKFADWKRFSELFPICLAGVLLRFLDHYIIIDWLHLWKIPIDGWLAFWVPISANITIWPIFCYLFIQYLPTKHRFTYGFFWLAGILLYLKMLETFNVFKIVKYWNFFFSFVNISIFLFLIYQLWKWLQKGAVKSSNKKSI